MISLIVPVYNVESYIEKCIDSILNQSYDDIEIILVDDGSTDSSGVICDCYSEKDPRIRVVHKENGGLSSARNAGLDIAKGAYIGFVDGDDWIESDMYECLMEPIETKEIDVVASGMIKDYLNRTVIRQWDYKEMTGVEAIEVLLRRELTEGVTDKLWSRRCFDSFRFPEGRVYEDVASTYLLFLSADKICNLPIAKYHYVLRDDSLSQHISMKNLIDYWLSNIERYEYLRDIVSESAQKDLLRYCSVAIVRTWAHFCEHDIEVLEPYEGYIKNMYAFSKGKIPLFGLSGWPVSLRVGVFLTHFNSPMIFRLSYHLNRVLKTNRDRKYQK